MKEIEQELESAIATFRSKNYEEAYRTFAPLASAGLAEAQFYLGRMYRFGEGVAPNLDKAVKWLTKAAKQGHTRAKRWLSDVLSFERCDNEGAEYWNKSAALDSTDGSWAAVSAYDQFRLFSRCRLSEAPPDERDQALRHICAAANHGIPQAKNKLADWYWFWKNSGNPTKNDRKLAIQLWREAAEAGDVAAQYWLGQLYSSIRHAPRDYAEALKWYDMAAEEGDVEALFNVGMLHVLGKGIEQNVEKGMKIVLRAAERGCATAMLALFDIYSEGKYGVKRDPANAKYWDDKLRQEEGPMSE